MPPDAFAKLTIEDLTLLYSAFEAAGAAFLSILNVPACDAAPAAVSLIEDEMDRCDWTLEHIANDLEKRQPNDLREESLRRATLLRAHADSDITEVLRVVALTIPSGSGSGSEAMSSNDPTFAAIAEWRVEQKKIIGSDVDVDGKHYADLTNKLFKTAPTTIPGILAMIEVFLDEDNEDDPRFLLKSIAAVLKPLAASA
jgi:hypothetical protein